jgi:hypothetical protein
VLVCASVLRALPPAAPPASPHTQAGSKDITSKDAEGPRRGFMPQVPTAQTCISARAPAAKLLPSTQTRRRYVAASASVLCASPPSAPPASPHAQTDRGDLTLKDAGGSRRGFVPQAPTVKTCISARAPAAKLRPSTQTRRRYVAANINLPLHR